MTKQEEMRLRLSVKTSDGVKEMYLDKDKWEKEEAFYNRRYESEIQETCSESGDSNKGSSD